MNIQPLIDAPLAVQVHVAAVVPAAAIGAVVLLRPKGTPVHRLLGRLWIGLMVATALSSFFIHSIDLAYGFSPIHLLSLYLLVGCWQVVHAARRGDIARHRAHVRSLYFGGIGIAGALTLLPGRIMNRIVFFDLSKLVFVVIMAAGISLIVYVLRGRIDIRPGEDR